MAIILDGTGTISGVSATGLTTAQTVTQSAIATGVAGTGPAFSAYQTSNVNLSINTDTKVSFATSAFDTNSNYNTSTSRFTPTVAGYYHLIAELDISGASMNNALAKLFKNGSIHKIGQSCNASNSEQYTIVSALVYANGTTDYFEVYAFAGGSAPIAYAAGNGTYGYFQGYMVRAA